MLWGVRLVALREVEFVFERKLYQGITAVNSQLLTDIGAVILDRAVADKQLRADLFARLMLADELQHAQFRRSQVLQAGPLFTQGRSAA